MQKWFKKSTLSTLWKFPHKLSCQNFLNHYKYVDQETSRKIEDDLCAAMIEMGITPHLLFLDESNWFTYIEKGEELPMKGKSKQFRYDKNLISIGLAVSEDMCRLCMKPTKETRTIQRYSQDCWTRSQNG